MPDKRGFIDTNVLVYLTSKDEDKAVIVEEILFGGGHISVQGLNELVNVLRRKMSYDWSAISTARDTVCALLDIHPVTIETHRRGVGLAERYGFATYDAMIVAAALEAECDTLWSEDMQHGMVVEGKLTILNPFLS